MGMRACIAPGPDTRSTGGEVEQEGEDDVPALVSTGGVGGVRSVRQRASIEGDVVTLTAETADVLRVKTGDIVRVKT